MVGPRENDFKVTILRRLKIAILRLVLPVEVLEGVQEGLDPGSLLLVTHKVPRTSYGLEKILTA